MSRGGAGNMLGVGGTRKHLGRKALRGGGRDGRVVGGGLDPRAQKRELLRKLQEQQREQQKQQEQREDRDGGDAGQEGRP